MAEVFGGDQPCGVCGKDIPVKQLAFGQDFVRGRCEEHMRHVECLGDCRICTCFVCTEIVDPKEVPVYVTCNCRAHQACVRSAIGEMRCKRCNKNVQIIKGKSPMEPSYFNPLNWFGAPKISRMQIIRNHQTPLQYIEAGVSGEDLYRSDLTAKDLVDLGFTLHMLLRMGMSPEMFLARFFCPEVIVGRMQTGPCLVERDGRYRFGGTDSFPVKGTTLLAALRIGLSHLFSANIGLLEAPPVDARQQVFAPSHFSVLQFTYDELKDLGMCFETVLTVGGPYIHWNLAFIAGGFDAENEMWLQPLPVSQEFKGYRGYHLKTQLGWSDKDALAVGVYNELEPPPDATPAEEPLTQEPGDFSSQPVRKPAPVITRQDILYRV